MNAIASNPFYGPRLKVERADKHIQEIEGIIREAFARYTKATATGTYHDSAAVGPITGRLPRMTPAIIGDAAHNLRAALDHLFAILVELNKQTVGDYTRFPFAQDRQSLKGFIKGIEKSGCAPSRKICDLIVNDIKPFLEPNQPNLLYSLHRLDIADKHTILIPTIQKTEIKRLKFTIEGGSTFEIRDLNLITREDQHPLGIEGRYRIEHESEAQITFDVIFAKGQLAQTQSVIATLKKMSQIVGGVIDACEAMSK